MPHGSRSRDHGLCDMGEVPSSVCSNRQGYAQMTLAFTSHMAIHMISTHDYPLCVGIHMISGMNRGGRVEWAWGRRGRAR
eukprot:10962742-Karenia_brevis.AAC.1